MRDAALPRAQSERLVAEANRLHKPDEHDAAHFKLSAPFGQPQVVELKEVSCAARGADERAEVGRGFSLLKDGLAYGKVEEAREVDAPVAMAVERMVPDAQLLALNLRPHALAYDLLELSEANRDPADFGAVRPERV